MRRATGWPVHCRPRCLSGPGSVRLFVEHPSELAVDDGAGLPERSADRPSRHDQPTAGPGGPGAGGQLHRRLLVLLPVQGHPYEPLTETPPGRLHLISDTLQPNGTRIAYYVALRPGAVTISSTVKIRTDQPVPEWSGLVIVT